MKKFCILFLLALLSINTSKAVLKEKNLKQTLSILRIELETYQKEQEQRMARMKSRQASMQQGQIQRMQEIDQIALMLYSQKIDYIFDLTYACHEATNKYRKFNENRFPFDEWQNSINNEIERYDALIESLNRIPPILLDSISANDKNICLNISQESRMNLLEQREQLVEGKERYNMMGDKLKYMNDYAEKRYATIRQNIFVNGGDSYFSILGNFSRYWRNATRSFNEKYGLALIAKSEWRGTIMLWLFVFVLFYLVISSLCSYVVIRWLMRRKFESDDSKHRRPYIILASSVLTFAIIMMLLRYFFISHNFFLMASKLFVEYAWLIGVVLVSLLVRLSAKQISSGFRIYVPILTMGFIIIVFRIIFIPNEMASILFPPILLFCSLWQWLVIRKHNYNIPRSDIFYTWISLAVMAVSVVVAWAGYTLLAVQILIWWIMMLTAIQTITCVYDLLSVYEKKKFTETDDISKTWFFDFIRRAVVPICAVYALMLSIYWAADVFDLTEWCKTIFNYYFIDIDNVAHVSISKLAFCVALFFVVKYIVYLGKKIYFKNQIRKYGSDKQVVSLGVNVATIAVWSLYVIIVMLILRINNAAIVVAIGGMSTGIGFALKDTIENLFYGISLMTGRVNIGDMIECDGVRGRVTNINYQSTMIEPVDGSVMAFLNSQLFQKNFKNLTRNHGDELVKIPVGVAYGTNVEKARQLILTGLEKLTCYNKKKNISLLFDNFGDNSVDLTLVIWVPVYNKVFAISEIKEMIYNVFNANGIEIPFPQRDVYVRQIVSPTIAKEKEIKD